MDNLSLPNAAQPPAYKDRRAGLIVFGIIQILIGVAWAGMTVLIAAVMPNRPQKAGEPALPPFLILGIALFLFPAISALVVLAAIVFAGLLLSVRSKFTTVGLPCRAA
jgi:hypothetical protein